MNILYLCHRVPYPPNKGEKIRAFHQLRALGGEHAVDLFTLSDETTTVADVQELKQCCRSVVVAPFHRRAARLRALPSLLSARTALTLPYFHSAELSRRIREAVSQRRYDRVFVYCSAMWQYIEGVSGIPILADFVDMDSDKWTQYAQRAPFPSSAIYRREGECLRKYERHVCGRAAAVIVTTEREAKLAREIAGGTDVHVIPNGVDAEFFRPRERSAEEGKHTIVFTGDMSYFPNVEAVQFFISRVLPLVRRAISGARFLIVGRDPSPAVRRLGREPGVEVTGFVPDTREYLGRARVAVAPFSMAFGIQNKILEALAFGLPVVGTRKVLQGLSPAVAEIVAGGDSAEELAGQVVRFLSDARLAQEIGMEGRRRVMADYNWNRSGERLLALMEQPGKAEPAGAGTHECKVAAARAKEQVPSSGTAAGKRERPQWRPARECTVLMLLTNTYEPDPRVRQEALALIAAGCRIRLLAWDRDLKSRAAESMEGVEVRRVHLRSKHGRGTTQLFFYARLYLKMLSMGWQTDFDAVHCHDLDTLPLGFLLGKGKRKPIVYDAHESFPDMLAGSVPRLVQGVLFRLENFLIRRVDLLITVGEKLRKNFEQRGARRTVTVGNWKRLEDYDRSRHQNLELRRRLGIPDSAMAVVCITQLLKDRQIEELLDAVDASPGVYAMVGGKGVLEDYVLERAARNPRILYLGFVRSADIPAYTCAADAIYYGFDPGNPNARYSAPNKLYEALAAGRVVITGDFGEIADVVREADCGIVLAQYSAESVRAALVQLLDSGRRESLAENARRYGRSAMNWKIGQEILNREYSALLPRAAAETLCVG